MQDMPGRLLLLVLIHWLALQLLLRLLANELRVEYPSESLSGLLLLELLSSAVF